MLSKLLDADSIVKLEELKSQLIEFVLQSTTRVRSSVEGRGALISLVVALLGLKVYYWHKYSYWSRLGVKTPPPWPILGNLHTLMLKPRQITDREWCKRYGKLHGFYLGTRPVLACGDVDVLNKICIKDFNKFRGHVPFIVPNRFEKNLLFLMSGEEWHNIRAAMSPTFSSGRIKNMFKLMDRCSKELIQAYDDRINKDPQKAPIVDPHELFRMYGLSASLSSFFSFGLDSESSASEERKEKGLVSKKNLIERSKQLFSVNYFRLLITIMIPFKLLEACGFSTNKADKMSYFEEKIIAIIENRKKSPRKPNDYLQLLLDTEDNQSDIKATSDQSEVHHAAGTSLEYPDNQKRKYNMTSEQITTQAITFLMFGSEIIGSVVSCMIFVLANELEIQEKLYRELSMIKLSHSDDGSTFDYDQLTSCEYLDCVISESLRMMPPAIIGDRGADEDYYIEKYNVTIPKGTFVSLSFYAIMHDPEYWPEPDKFIPERFAKENKSKIIPGSYCPFGVGPRFCIAFRFALMMAKISLARLILEFKFAPNPGTKYPGEFNKLGLFSIFKFKDPNVRVSRR